MGEEQSIYESGGGVGAVCGGETTFICGGAIGENAHGFCISTGRDAATATAM